ncbi:MULTISPECIES: hypothetical protein [unclassified Paracoccus (in: a-proteobacteria)]|uniref:hypothetical protein n=1 Tax=unclassified Paracoccus (in: a-proteobacteria) TaxID=2688777 RepID=UPI0018A6BBDB|nr:MULTISPECIES: hypothetical protein [unclassified Paracoccus (in: a-proteobacteria)]UXU75891.1 hypothetical protein GB879_005235 [Paracoccus sp. SMMA_5]UXU81801.1 hypothetical protein GB880_005225 [Paracoccus sp. SMMA_5_TC]
MRQGDLAGLHHVAKLRADLELRHFAAYRSHVEQARARINALQEEICALHRSDMPFSLEQARLANAQTQALCQALTAAETELERMLPGYEQSRQTAARAFGRCEAIAELKRQEKTRQQYENHRREADRAANAASLTQYPRPSGGNMS